MVAHISVILHLITKSYLTTVRGIPPSTGSNKLWGVSVSLLYWGSHTFTELHTYQNMMVLSAFLTFSWKQTQHKLINSKFRINECKMPMFNPLLCFSWFRDSCLFFKHTMFAEADALLSALWEVSQAGDGTRAAAGPRCRRTFSSTHICLQRRVPFRKTLVKHTCHLSHIIYWCGQAAMRW